MQKSSTNQPVDGGFKPRPLGPLLGAAGCVLWFRVLCLGLLLAAGPIGAPGQESVRLSLAGAEAARSRRAAAAALANDNFKLGPTAWAFSPLLEIEANDNIRLESTHPRADLVFHPRLDTQLVWPVSEFNSLTFSAGAGYSAYVAHPEFNRLFITPGSELSLDLYVGDFWVNLHDRFSIIENTYQDPTVVGSADYSQLINSLGQTTTWDLNKLLLRLGYDHVNYVCFQGSPTPSSRPSGWSEVFSAAAGYRLRPALSAGVELGGSLLHYSDSGSNPLFTDATEWNAGAFLNGQITPYLHGRLSAGYTLYTPQDPGFLGDSLDYSGLYAQGELTHRLNRFLVQTLSFGRMLSFAFYNGTIDLYFARWRGQWKLLRGFSLATTFEYQHGSQLVTQAETFDRFGPGISLGRTIAPKWAADLAYQYYYRLSDAANRNYTVNILTLSLRYTL